MSDEARSMVIGQGAVVRKRREMAIAINHEVHPPC